MKEINVEKTWESQGIKLVFKTKVIAYVITEPSLKILKGVEVLHEHGGFEGWTTRNMDYRAFEIFSAFVKIYG